MVGIGDVGARQRAKHEKSGKDGNAGPARNVQRAMLQFSPVLAALACLTLPLSAASIADQLAAAKWTHHAKAPGYSEGPTWLNGEVFFCSGALLKVDKTGKVFPWLDISPAGTFLRRDSQLLIADNKHKALLSLATNGVVSVLADQFEGQPLNSLNDLTVDARGNIYWTDPSGSSVQKPVGNIFRLTPAGKVTRAATGLAFPNGVDVDPASKFLYFIEPQSKKILRLALPANDDAPLGPSELFYDLGGSGGDGCAFDAAGNLWVADFHRPETKKGRITVLSPDAKVLGQLDVPAQVVSNITFGGANHDEIFCTTGTPDGVFHAKVGVKGFTGHPGAELKALRTLATLPHEGAHPLHARRFGVPGNIGISRGWYVWRKFDRATWTGEFEHEGNGEIFTAKILPWTTTYRHLTYGAHVDEPLPGERVNCFFNPDGDKRRGWLVHYQDEVCQMKGHNHAWIIQSVKPGGREFSAQVFAGDKPFEDKPRDFQLATDAKFFRHGQRADSPALKTGDRLYFTWTKDGDRRVVRLLTDDASLDAVKKIEADAVAARIALEGLTGQIEAVDGETVHFLIHSSYWSQGNQLKPGQLVHLRATDAQFAPAGDAIEAELVSRKNLGTYGSGVNETTLKLKNPADAKKLAAWKKSQVVRVIAK
jgi:sugar lactone lactonase YvrE